MDAVAAERTLRPTAAIVLAGGRGVRRGRAEPKAVVEHGGSTLLARAVALGAAVAEIVLVAAPADLALELPAAAVRVEDRTDGGGPLAGLLPALGRAHDLGAAGCFVLAVDLPALAGRDLRALAAADGGDAAVVPRSARGLEPQVAWIGAIGPVAREFDRAWRAGERSLHGAYERLGPALGTVDIADPARWPGGEAVLRGVNTPAEFAAAERALAASGPPA